MKILFVQKLKGIAGSEKYLLNILPELKKQGINVSFLAIQSVKDEIENNDFFRELEKFNIPIFKSHLEKTWDLTIAYRITKIVNLYEYDIVHTHLIHADFYLALSKLFFKRNLKLASTKHGFDEKYNAKYGFETHQTWFGIYRVIAYFSELQINRSFAITHGLRTLFVDLKITKKENIDVIHYGFDFEDTQGTIDQFRYAKNQLIIVGRLIPFKGHKYAFNALAILLKEIKDLKLVVVGSGELSEQLVLLTKELEIENHVIFHGYQENARNHMADSDIVLLPSIAEGFGVVILEAFSVSKPIVAFNVPSPKEIIEHGFTGLLTKPFNSLEFSNNIKTLLMNKNLASTMGTNGNEKLKNYFNVDRMVKETIEFYEKL